MATLQLLSQFDIIHISHLTFQHHHVKVDAISFLIFSPFFSFKSNFVHRIEMTKKLKPEQHELPLGLGRVWSSNTSSINTVNHSERSSLRVSESLWVFHRPQSLLLFSAAWGSVRIRSTLVCPVTSHGSLLHSHTRLTLPLSLSFREWLSSPLGRQLKWHEALMRR